MSAPIVDGIAISHSKVLYTQAEKELFNSGDHEEFKSTHRVIDLTPVWEADSLVDAEKVKSDPVSEEARKWMKKMLKDIHLSITTVFPDWAEEFYDYELWQVEHGKHEKKKRKRIAKPSN